MEKFCHVCGSPYTEGQATCAVCGAVLSVDAPADVSAPNPTGTTLVAPSGLVGMIKNYVKFVYVGLALFALILAYLNFTGSYEISATTRYGDNKWTSQGDVSDLYEAEEATMLKLGNYGNAILMLAAAAVAALGALKEFNISDLGDQFLPGSGSYKALTLAGLAGAGGCVIQVIGFALTSLIATADMEFEVKISFGIPGFTWAALVIFAGAFICDRVILSKNDQ